MRTSADVREHIDKDLFAARMSLVTFCTYFATSCGVRPMSSRVLCEVNVISHHMSYNSDENAHTSSRITR